MIHQTTQIETESEYEVALKEIEQLFNADPGSPEGHRLEELALLLQKFEDEHYSIPRPTFLAKIFYHFQNHRLFPKCYPKSHVLPPT
ncbi:MAG: hypothetical protein ACOY0R_12715 [Chloroflexota bacterium]|jgi:HTH-type transcriptional regulator/antitoxin HigA